MIINEWLIDGIYDTMLDTGRITKGYKIVVKEPLLQLDKGSDYKRLIVDLIPPRKRKAKSSWIIIINTVSKTIHWDMSEYISSL